MAGKFLDLDLDDDKPTRIGDGLKRKPRPARPDLDRAAIAETGRAHGFDRSTAPAPTAEEAPPPARRGRPPLRENMTYWRIYVSPKLRAELNALRDVEGRRLNDLLADMLAAYKRAK